MISRDTFRPIEIELKIPEPPSPLPPKDVHPAVIELVDVQVVLGGQTILNNVNINIFKGETIGIIGPSGSGKSVLLKTMAGIFKPKNGVVYLEGRDRSTFNRQDKHEVAREIGMLFQESALFDSLTLIQNIAFPMRQHLQLDEKTILDRSQKLLEKVNLGNKRDHFPYEISGGMKRRLGIARALALDPKLLLFDAPVAGQDPVQEDQILELIESIKKLSDTTLVIVTSSMSVVYRMATRIFMTIDGEVLDLGTPEEAKKNRDQRVQQFIRGELEGPIDVKSL